MNMWCGRDGGNADAGIQVVARLSQITNPGPGKMWIFADTHEDSLNAGGFTIDLVSILQNGEYIWSGGGLPAARHGGNGVLAFADGHSELRKWKDSRTLFDIQEKYRGMQWQGGNVDLYWLADHASQKRNVPEQ